VSRGIDAARFRALLGRFATGVTVLTLKDAHGRPRGMTASAVAAASLDPPLVLVCVDRRADLHPLLEDRVSFVLNVLAADQETLSRRFAADEGDRFAGVAFRANAGGLPLLDGAVAHLECAWHSMFPSGDHTTFLGLVTSGAVSERRPLLHHRGGYGSLADG
jgi:flavin reductase (DIM6/NTAB) family NADH-FMN oxidoreductase RutF